MVLGDMYVRVCFYVLWLFYVERVWVCTGGLDGR